MTITIEQFIERLHESGLMPAAEVATFQDSLPPEQRPRDVQALAACLVRAGKLTKYQAQAVYQGRTKGLVFGEYVVLDKLGEGGMGVVVKAQHRRMKRLVAVKMIAPKALGSPDAVKRFYREVEAAAKLNHPNIAQAYDASEHQGMHYLVMEYVEGKDLGAIIQEDGPLPVSQAVECIVQAARGLGYAHEQGVVHRDIKPNNLLVDKQGAVKILDMGLARVAGLQDPNDQDRLTSSGQVMGTCEYMAPEQAFDARQAGRRGDIYSLGCTLYRLLTGEVPYQGETLMQVLLSHREAPIPPLCQARPEVSPQLDAVYQKMLAKEPGQRQQTMAEVIADLERCLARRGGAAQALGEHSSSGDALTDALSFLQEGPAVGTVAVGRKKAASEAATIAHAPPQPAQQPRKLLTAVRQKPWLAGAVALGLFGMVVLLLAIILRIQHPDGKETVMQVPEGSNVTIKKDGRVDVKLPKAKGLAEVKAPTSKSPSSPSRLPPPATVPPKAAQAVAPAKPVAPVEKWELPPGAPPPAIAPFDTAKAKEHQEAWAKYLKVPVEMTNEIGMVLVLIPPGEFTMGEGGEAHKVRITKPFYLGKYEVTQEEWEAVMGKNPSQFKGPKNPVEQVSWNECQEFLGKLSEKGKTTKGRYCLPTEAQWEYACRAGTTGKWFFGDSEGELSDYAWYEDNAEGKTHPVGEKKANGWGLYDVYGNVWEWCADWRDGNYYKASPLKDPAGPDAPPDPKGSPRVLRGGCWSGGAGGCRSASRYGFEPGVRHSHLGLRASLVLVDK